MTDLLKEATPTEAWVVEVCVLGREQTGPWRVEFAATETSATIRADEWDAGHPAGYSYRVRRYVPANDYDRLLQVEQAAKELREELMAVLEVAIARGENEMYEDEDYRERLAALRRLEGG